MLADLLENGCSAGRTFLKNQKFLTFQEFLFSTHDSSEPPECGLIQGFAFNWQRLPARPVVPAYGLSCHLSGIREVDLHDRPGAVQSSEVQTDSMIRTATPGKLDMYAILTDRNFPEEVLENPQPVLVEISADWCDSWHIMAPVLEKLAIEFEGQIKFGRRDAQANAQTARVYGMDELPLRLLFKDGQRVDHLVGVVARQALEAKIKMLTRTAGG